MEWGTVSKLVRNHGWLGVNLDHGWTYVTAETQFLDHSSFDSHADL